MDQINQAILNMLKVNMGYQEGESIAVVAQKWSETLGQETKTGFDASYLVAKKIFEVIKKAGYDITFIEYSPKEARNGADATQEAYDNIGNEDIIFMPTAFSLTHTPFRLVQTDKGARVASMPRFSLEMFEENGPMAVDYKEVETLTNDIKEKLQKSKFVRISGNKTNIIIDIDQENVKASYGMITKKGQYGNLPGAEAYLPPTHLGKSNGYFTVPKNWGGIKPLKHQATFHIKDGRFVDVVGEDKEAQEYINKEIKPQILPGFGAGKNFDVLAELGIGTNLNITPEYMEKTNWTTLLAEKIIGSAHFASGNSKAMGGENDVRVHIDWVVPNVKIEYNFSLFD